MSQENGSDENTGEKVNKNELITKAEIALWNIFSKKLKNNHKPEAAYYLKHLLKFKHVTTTSRFKYKEVSFDLFRRFSDYSSLYNGNTGELISWAYNKNRENSGSRLSKEKCLEIARSYVNLPDDAKLEESDFEMVGNDTFYVARWIHIYRDIEVEGDFIQISLNAGTGLPFGFYYMWHQVNENYSVR